MAITERQAPNFMNFMNLGQEHTECCGVKYVYSWQIFN